MEEHDDISETLKTLSQTDYVKNEEVFNFGKYKDVPVQEVLRRDPGYYSWIMQGDFALNTKQVLTRIRLNTQNTLF